jgi:hypothetical protein
MLRHSAWAWHSPYAIEARIARRCRPVVPPQIPVVSMSLIA